MDKNQEGKMENGRLLPHLCQQKAKVYYLKPINPNYRNIHIFATTKVNVKKINNRLDKSVSNIVKRKGQKGQILKL